MSMPRPSTRRICAGSSGLGHVPYMWPHALASRTMTVLFESMVRVWAGSRPGGKTSRGRGLFGPWSQPGSGSAAAAACGGRRRIRERAACEALGRVRPPGRPKRSFASNLERGQLDPMNSTLLPQGVHTRLRRSTAFADHSEGEEPRAPICDHSLALRLRGRALLDGSSSGK